MGMNIRGIVSLLLTLSADRGALYFLVYTLALATIFPVSPGLMRQALSIIEVLGTIAFIPLIFFSVQGTLNSLNVSSERIIGSGKYSKIFVYFVFFLVTVGIVIIIFATKSAMGN